MYPHHTSIRRSAIAAALACLALFCTTGSAAAAAGQDLRNPDNRVKTSSLAGTVSPKQDLRSPDARDATTRHLPQAPTWPVDPKPITPAPAAVARRLGGGVDWVAIVLAAVAAVAVSGAGVALVARSRRPQRVRVSA